MISPNSQSVAKVFSKITGLPVRCKERPSITPSKAKAVYGIYNKFPEYETILLRADLSLLATFAGIRAGLSDSLIAERLKEPVIDQPLQTAMREVLSSSSTLLSTVDRVVFKSMCMDVRFLNGPARSVLNSHNLVISYEVSIEGYGRGFFSLFADS